MNSAFNSTMDSAAKLQLGPEAMSVLSGYAEGLQKRLGQLAQAGAANNLGAVDHHTNQILDSFGAAVCAVVRSIKLKPEETPPTFAQIKARARALDGFRPVPEAVITWLEPKISGGVRQLVAFGWRRRALQCLCGDILSALYPPYPFDFSTKGKGGHKAAHIHLGKLIDEGEFEYVVTSDIKDCYGSAKKKKVGELLTALPTKVVNNVILIQDDVTVVVKPDKGTWTGVLLPNTYPATTIHATDEAARRGLPQGSSTSGIIMNRAVLGPLLSSLSFAHRIVLIGDDLAVPVKDRSEGEAVLNALKSLYAASPVGLLTIGRHSVDKISDGYDFCGYRTVRKPQKWGGHLHRRPSLRAYEKSQSKAAEKFREAGGGLPGWKKVFLYVKPWMRSFSLWKPNYLSKLYVWYQLQAASWH